MITPEEAAEKYWEIHNELRGYDKPKSMGFQTLVAIMAKFLPQITEDAVADERARCAKLVRENMIGVPSFGYSQARYNNTLEILARSIEKGQIE